jgi:hypothetical protein
MRPIGLELSMCQSYYQTGVAIDWGYNIAGNAVGGSFNFVTQMRAIPTVTLSAGANDTNISSVTVIERFTTGFSALGIPISTGDTYWRRVYAASAEL